MKELRFLASLTVVSGLGLYGCKSDEAASKQAPPPPPTAQMAPPMPSVRAPEDVPAPPPDAEKTPTGLAMKVIQPGTGTTHPEEDQLMVMSYVGWKKDGVMFDQSPPLELNFGQLTPGWAEGMRHMVAGEKRRLWIPSALAFGEHPKPGTPAGDITMDITLVSIGRKILSHHASAAVAAEPIAAPDDVAAPPKGATKTKSGLAYRTLSPGKGAQPKATDTVVVQYTGWTPDGKMFDSSVTRGKAATFALDHVIKGWTEGVELMHVGEKTRFWVPSDLAYGDKPARAGAPAGKLVFDIELVGIEPKAPVASTP